MVGRYFKILTLQIYANITLKADATYIRVYKVWPDLRLRPAPKNSLNLPKFAEIQNPDSTEPNIPL